MGLTSLNCNPSLIRHVIPGTRTLLFDLIDFALEAVGGSKPKVTSKVGNYFNFLSTCGGRGKRVKG